MLLYAAIISYILSLVLALILTFTSKKLNPGWFRIVAGIHIVLGVLFLYSLFSHKEGSEAIPSFLFFFCSGIIASGLAFGMNQPIAFKIYFGLFDTSLLLFLISPSTLLNFLLTASFSNTADMIPVQGKYYLERQNTVTPGSENTMVYKLIGKQGLFHQTMARNLNFKGTLDSIKVLRFEEHVAAEIRGYTSRKTYVSDELDSTDITIDLNPKKQDVIERKL